MFAFGHVFLLFLSLGAVVLARKRTNPSQSTALKIVNHAGKPIEVFWMEDGSTSRLFRQLESPLRNSTDADLWSYNGHQFLIRFRDHSDDAAALAAGHSQGAVLTKGKADETYFVKFNESSQSLYVELEDKFAGWKSSLHHARGHCRGLHGDALADCVTKAMHTEVNTLTSSIETLTKSMGKVSHRLRNYTCDDDSLPTSTPLSTHAYRWHDRAYTVQTLLNMSHAQIWLVDGFITEQECAELEKVGRPRLYRATVAAEDGSSVVSENRKAQQAAYDLHQQRGVKDPLWDLQQRLLDITNSHTGYGLTHEGQEGFTIIQYNPDDQYTPHCDGSCDHTPHTPHGRIATAVMYCKVPERGGATTFTRANLLVRPKLGAVTFFTYRGADGRMDPGYTEHSGCPVKAGEKLITTFWMRDGVSQAEPWSRYDPIGLPILDAAHDA